MITRWPLVAVTIALIATAACSDPPELVDNDRVYVWRVLPGDSGGKAARLAAALGLPAPQQEGYDLVSAAAGARLVVTYATGRATFHGAVPVPGLAMDAGDDAMIDAAAAFLHDLALLPAGTEACACAAGLDGCSRPTPGRSRWKDCGSLAVRVYGLPSDLTPDLAAPPAEPAHVDGDATGTVVLPEPIEVAFTPRLPIRQLADGTVTYGELAGGAADLIVRFADDRTIVGIDDRFQPPTQPPIEVELRPVADVVDELRELGGAPEDVNVQSAPWALGYFGGDLTAPAGHAGSHHAATFYYPMYLKGVTGLNIPSQLITATRFLPRIVSAELPTTWDVTAGPAPALSFDVNYGSRPVVEWYVQHPALGWQLLASASAVPDPTRASTLTATLTAPPPNGDQILRAVITDGSGTHYQFESMAVAVIGSSTPPFPAAHGSHVASWTACGTLSRCHTDDVKVTAVPDGAAKTGVVKLKGELTRQPGLGAAWSRVFFDDLSLRQFHLDLKLRLPERKKDLARGWAEDWPAAADPDAITVDGKRYKDLWIRTDTCKLDAAGTYLCDVVPNGVSPTNPNRKLGMLCPADFNHANEQGDEDAAQCTTPASGAGELYFRRVVTGLPGRLTINVRFATTAELPGSINPSEWTLSTPQGSILRLVNPDTGKYSARDTARLVEMLGHTAKQSPGIKPRVTWKWEGDKPRARPDGMKKYGGMEAECLNVLELCRQANAYDPRTKAWNFGGAKLRDEYPEAASRKMSRPWERGVGAIPALPAADRNEGDARPYCPHELYKVLKERFCPCDDNGDPDERTSMTPVPNRANPGLQVLEVRLGLYMRMTPFEEGNGGALVIADHKGLPEMLMGLEGHGGKKLGSVIPDAKYLNDLPDRITTAAGWAGLLFPAANLVGWGANVFFSTTRMTFDLFVDWIDAFHWFQTMEKIDIVRPLAWVKSLDDTPELVNSHYAAALGAVPQVPFPGPSSNFGLGDKSGQVRFPVASVAVPAGHDQKGFWQNIHLKSWGPSAPIYYDDVVFPGCQALFPQIRTTGAGGKFWSWDRNLCLHHHESWFRQVPKQANHDMAWIFGAKQRDQNPSRVGAVYPNTNLWTQPNPQSNLTLHRMTYWEFTVTRANSNFMDTTTFETEWFFSQGPSTW